MKKEGNNRTVSINPNGFNDSGQESGQQLVPVNISEGEIMPSYIFTTSGRSISKYGERLLMELLSVAKEYTIDKALGINKLNFEEVYAEKFAIIDIPVRNILNDDDTSNYTAAKNAALDLMGVQHCVETPLFNPDGTPKYYKNGKRQYSFTSEHLLEKVEVNVKPSTITVKLGGETWNRIFDMGKGYTRYNILTAKTLDNPTAIRLFQLMSNTSAPLTYSIDKLKVMLNLQGKYDKNVPGFINRVIVPAEQEINEKCPFILTHTPEYSTEVRRGKPGIVGLTFRKETRPSAAKDPLSTLSAQLITLLIRNYGFTEAGIRANIKTFDSAVRAGVDIPSFLGGIEDNIRKASSKPAYIIKSLDNLVRSSGAGEGSAKKIEIATPSEKSRGGRQKKEPSSGTPASTASRKRLKVNTAEDFMKEDSGLEEL